MGKLSFLRKQESSRSDANKVWIPGQAQNDKSPAKPG